MGYAVLVLLCLVFFGRPAAGIRVSPFPAMALTPPTPQGTQVANEHASEMRRGWPVEAEALQTATNEPVIKQGSRDGTTTFPIHRIIG
jgi:hypothetical protein